MTTIEQLIYDSYAKTEQPHRPHIGCSTLGHPCDRALWLKFHWAVTENFDGRKLKLFQFGHDYEATVIKELTKIGCRITGTQKLVDFGSHVSGSIDGLITGLPGYELETLLLEAKTLNDKSWRDLQRHGIEKSKPMYHVQMQCYLKGLKLNKGLLYALNKNTSEIYTEIVHYNEDVALSAIERGHRIASIQRMPEPIAATSEYYVCRMCPMSEFCHQTQCTKNVNCRTCANAVPTDNNTWHCKLHDDTIPYIWQLGGCDSHILHAELIPYRVEQTAQLDQQSIIIGEKLVMNGTPASGVYSSKEILADPALCASADPFVEQLRHSMNARIVAAE